ncbi:hypothetical protein CLOM_g6231 [Closterium sp. NIES-68]|nr:hypothetical protein CLOM_g6231 [Closterium sp. NIES-68]GJP77623.1 hypothetical protein CLOP_g7983 [Closterium sp. NIES-67]GJP80254.1 hypothetical protein CLOP_g10486 [Closterium sp. NIES-67]
MEVLDNTRFSLRNFPLALLVLALVTPIAPVLLILALLFPASPVDGAKYGVEYGVVCGESDTDAFLPVASESDDLEYERASMSADLPPASGISTHHRHSATMWC